MDQLSLPRFAAKRHMSEAGEFQEPKSSRRVSRIALNSLLVIALGALLYWLRITTLAIEASRATIRLPPVRFFEFATVMEKYPVVKAGLTREKIEELLGPPTHRNAWEPEFILCKYSYCNWHKWADLNNEDRWLAVVYLSWELPQRALLVLKKGF